jgi:hypothetical protein
MRLTEPDALRSSGGLYPLPDRFDSDIRLHKMTVGTSGAVAARMHTPGVKFMVGLAEWFRRWPVEPATGVRFSYPTPGGALAHLGERRTCNAEAVGAEPTCSTKIMYLSCNMIAQVRPGARDDVWCCESCHVDHDEFGSDLCAVDGPDGSLGEHSGGVCCAVSRYLDEKPLTAQEWEALRVLS